MRLNMHLSTALPALVLASAVTANFRRDGAADTTAGTIGSKKYIVEVVPGTDVDALAQKLNAASGSNVIRTFKTDVFTGLSIESKVENLDSLLNLGEISQAWPSTNIALAPPDFTKLYAEQSTANYSVHWATGVEQAHSAGYFGKGVTIAIVDTGVDYTHPALGGGFGPGFKIAGGWDLVGDGDWAPANYGSEKVPDSDPMDLNGHGTHVAGIIAGKAEGFTGVAPEAQILSYKVFAQGSGTDEDTLIDAFLMAYEAGADIITSSIGSHDGGWSTGAWATVASRLVEEGLVVTIAAGNDGTEGPFYFSSGSSGTNVIGVASIEPEESPGIAYTATITVDGVSTVLTLGYNQYIDLDIRQWEMTGVELVQIPGGGSNGCDPLEGDYDFTGKVVLVPRTPNCYPYKVQPNFSQYNAQAVLFYNDDRALYIGHPPYPYWSEPTIGITDKPAADLFLEAFAANGTIILDFYAGVASSRVGMFNSAGGRPDFFTSMGPTYDLDIKPDIAAPGGSIFSTYLGGIWAMASGTSMACPYVAGVAALYIGKYGGRSVHGRGFGKEMQQRIIASGAAVPWNVEDNMGLNEVYDNTETVPKDYGVFAPTVQVGGGLIDAWKILSYTTTLTYEKFVLNDTAHFSRYHQVDIKNGGDSTVVYNFTLQPWGGFEAYADSSSSYPVTFGYDLVPLNIVPKVSLPTGTFKVAPGATKTAKFSFSIPSGVNEEFMPMYGGKILITGSNGEELSLPYMGAAFDIRKRYENMFGEGGPRQLAGPLNEDIYEYHAYTFNTDEGVWDYPQFQVALRFGCPEFRIDIFESGWQERHWVYPPVVGENGFIGSIGAYMDYGFDPRSMVSLPLYGMARNAFNPNINQFYWLGEMSDGTLLAPGTYAMRLAALRPYSTNPSRSDNWSVWKTPEITVLAA